MTNIRLSQPADAPAPPNTFTDFDWIRENETNLLEQYGEGFILVYQQQVIGFGSTLDAAIDDAQQHLPAGAGEITPVIDTLHRRYPLTRAIRRKLSISLDDLGDEAGPASN